MKKIYILSIFITMLFSLTLRSQSTELWGMTTNGGDFYSGTIFKTDANGNNHTVEHSFYKNLAENINIRNLVLQSQQRIHVLLSQFSE